MQTNYETTKNIPASSTTNLKFHFPIPHLYGRWWMSFLLISSDVICLLLAEAFAIALRVIVLRGNMPLDIFIQYRNEAPFLMALFLVVYAISGLYPGVGLSPVEELRKLAVSTTGVFLFLAAFSALLRNFEAYSRLIFVFAWVFALILVQFGRWMTRFSAVRLGAWGEPVAVVGYGSQGQLIVDYLLKNMRLGLRPSLIIDGFGKSVLTNSQVPLVRLSDTASTTVPLEYARIRTAILVISEIPEALQSAIIDEGKLGFDRLIIISSLGWIGSMAVIPHDMEGILGLEVRQNLLSPWDQAIKQVVDIVLIMAGCLFALPLIGLIACLIRLDSRGPLFYRQERFGKGGKRIKMWKFRTMVPNADKFLEDYLVLHPELRVEWETTQKIKNDPRVTRIGRILRKTSLDELPQIWNVLRGEMSLVGPRPIVADEIKLYGRTYKLYSRVRPGITGLWQVSGRNDLSYDFRLRLDEYYVRNWSIWLDIYILIRTVLVVLRRTGAY